MPFLPGSRCQGQGLRVILNLVDSHYGIELDGAVLKLVKVEDYGSESRISGLCYGYCGREHGCNMQVNGGAVLWCISVIT